MNIARLAFCLTFPFYLVVQGYSIPAVAVVMYLYVLIVCGAVSLGQAGILFHTDHTEHLHRYYATHHPYPPPLPTKYYMHAMYFLCTCETELRSLSSRMLWCILYTFFPREIAFANCSALSSTDWAHMTPGMEQTTVRIWNVVYSPKKTAVHGTLEMP